MAGKIRLAKILLARKMKSGVMKCIHGELQPLKVFIKSFNIINFE